MSIISNDVREVILSSDKNQNAAIFAGIERGILNTEQRFGKFRALLSYDAITQTIDHAFLPGCWNLYVLLLEFRQWKKKNSRTNQNLQPSDNITERDAELYEDFYLEKMLGNDVVIVNPPKHVVKAERPMRLNSLDVGDVPKLVARRKRHVSIKKDAIDLDSSDYDMSPRPVHHPVFKLPPNIADILQKTGLESQLKSHQKEGVAFLWDNIVTRNQSGCILAHSMGLGKTLQVLAFLSIYRRSHQPQSNILILCPTTVVESWYNEYHRWFPSEEQRRDVGPLFRINRHSAPTMSDRLAILRDWHHHQHGILLMSYRMYYLLVDAYEKSNASSSFTTIYHTMILPGPHLMVADEGHIIKNHKAGITRMVSLMTATRRICLTGYPLQNNLEEYWCMVNFVRPKFLGQLSQFRYQYIHPIQDGLSSDSIASSVQLARKKLHLLQNFLKDFVLRRDVSAIQNDLPAKHEFVITCRLTLLQEIIYKAFLEHIGKKSMTMGNVLMGSLITGLISNHPKVLLKTIDDFEIRHGRTVPTDDDSDNDTEAMDIDDYTDQDTDRSMVIDTDMDLDNGVGTSVGKRHRMSRDAKKKTIFDVNDEENAEDDDGSDGEYRVNKKRKMINKDDQYLREAMLPKSIFNLHHGNDNHQISLYQMPWVRGVIKDALKQMGNKSSLNDVAHSNKAVIAAHLILESALIGDKILLFSQSITTLDYLEKVVLVQMNLDHPNLIFPVRLDGSTPVHKRQERIDEFNHPSSRTNIFLISTRAGSLGINLSAANRVILYDVSWNPCHDEQALVRVYRYGQKKQVYIYRLFTFGTFEDKIYKNALWKQTLSKRVIDHLPLARNVARRDLTKYFLLQKPPDMDEVHVQGIVTTDSLLNAMLRHLGRGLVVGVHMHDAMFHRREEEALSPLEARAVQLEFEEEQRKLSKSAERLLVSTQNNNYHPSIESMKKLPEMNFQLPPGLTHLKYHHGGNTMSSNHLPKVVRERTLPMPSSFHHSSSLNKDKGFSMAKEIIVIDDSD